MMREYHCVYHHNTLTKEILQKNAALFPEAYDQAHAMLELAKTMADEKDSKLLYLPFDYMVEAEAFGADVVGREDGFGLRSGAASYQSVQELLALKPFDFRSGRLAAVLEACSLANQKGYTVCLNLSGLLTVLEILLSMPRLFSQWRKEPEDFFAFAKFYEQQLVGFAIGAAGCGCRIFSYSDPVATVSVIGEKRAAVNMDQFVLPLIKDLRRNIPGCLIHLCGRTSYVLENLGLVKTKDIILVQAKGYQDAVVECLQTHPEGMILAHGCINSNKPTSVIKETVLV